MSEKTVCKKTTIFTKRKGFFGGYIVFLLFFDKNRAKVRFQSEFQEKPPAKTRQFLQNVTVYLQSTSCFYSFLQKKGKRGISDRDWGKTPYCREGRAERLVFNKLLMVKCLFVCLFVCLSVCSSTQIKINWKLSLAFSKNHIYWELNPTRWVLRHVQHRPYHIPGSFNI